MGVADGSAKLVASVAAVDAETAVVSAGLVELGSSVVLDSLLAVFGLLPLDLIKSSTFVRIS
jgi:hypothetical protein